MKGLFENLFPARRAASRHTAKRRASLSLEALEERSLLSVFGSVLGTGMSAPLYNSVDAGDTTGPGDVIAQPVLGVSPNQLGSVADLLNTPSDPAAPLGAILGESPDTVVRPDAFAPALSSNSGASHTLYLNFNGDYRAQWTGKDPYGNTWTFPDVNALDHPQAVIMDPYERTALTPLTDAQRAQITEIWWRVAEDYAPFDVNVTTVDPGNLDNGKTLMVDIGQSNGWFTGSEGVDESKSGISSIGSFTDDYPNVVFAFVENIAIGYGAYNDPTTPAKVADTVSHEAGHSFGLLHHHALNADGTLQNEYDPGSGNWTPIMGDSLNQNTRHTWGIGMTGEVGIDSLSFVFSNTPIGTYDDRQIEVDSNVLGAVLGFRADDFGDDSANATPLNMVDGTGVASGIVGLRPFDPFGPVNRDVDVFSFDNAFAGQVTVRADVLGYHNGSNLNAHIELWSGDHMIAAADPYDDQGNAQLVETLAPGTYYVKVMGAGEFDAGRYTLTVQAPSVFGRVGTMSSDESRLAGKINGFAADTTESADGLTLDTQVMPDAPHSLLDPSKLQVPTYSSGDLWSDPATLEVPDPIDIQNAGDTTGDGGVLPLSGSVSTSDAGYIAIMAKYNEFGEAAKYAFGDPLPGDAGKVHVTAYAAGAPNTADALGRGIEFTNGAIYWSRATGAHAIFGDIFDGIRAKWLDMGGTAYGYPTAENLSYSLGRGYGTTMLQDFMRSDGDYRSIVMWQMVNPAAAPYDDWFKHGIGTDPGIPYYINVTHAVYGDIRDIWMDWGGVQFGVPIGDEHHFHHEATSIFDDDYDVQWQNFKNLYTGEVNTIRTGDLGVWVHPVLQDDLTPDESKFLDDVHSFVAASGDLPQDQSVGTMANVSAIDLAMLPAERLTADDSAPEPSAESLDTAETDATVAAPADCAPLADQAMGDDELAMLQALASVDALPADDAIAADQADAAVAAVAVNSLVINMPATTTAGQPIIATVTAYDADGNVVAGYNGTIHFESSDAQATLPADAMLVNGSADFEVVFRTAGPASLSVVDTVDGALTAAAGVDVSAAAAASLVINLPTQTRDSAAFAAAAGEATIVTITAYDAFGNVAAGYNGTVSLSVNARNALLPAAVTFTDGTATFAATFEGPAAVTLSAADVDQGVSGSADVTVTGPATSTPRPQAQNDPRVFGPSRVLSVSAHAFRLWP